MFASLATNTGEAIQYLRDGKTLVMTGAAVSNLWHLQDSQNNNQEAGFFVFPDLSIRSEGNYRLKFTLFEVKGYASCIVSQSHSHPIAQRIRAPLQVHLIRYFLCIHSDQVSGHAEFVAV